MLPVPSAGVGGIEFPSLPPRPSGPNPSGPGTFASLYDRLWTKEEASRGLPTSMEVAPILMPASDLGTPFVASPEFPDAVNPDGLRVPGKPETRRADPVGDLLAPFGQGLAEVNRLHAKATALTQEAAVGGDVDLHDVMIATEKAGVATQLTLQIRNKLVEAYQDVMRMQV